MRMKTLLKILGFIGIIIAILVSIWYFYFFKRWSTLQDVDRQLILESLKEDSDGKGYSDEAQKLIEEDFNKITNMNEEEKAFLKKWNILLTKQERKTPLSKNREEFLKNIELFYKTLRCFELYVGNIEENEIRYHFLYPTYEKKEFYKYFNVLERKNFRFLSFDEIFSIQNPEMSKEKCDILEKEIK